MDKAWVVKKNVEQEKQKKDKLAEIRAILDSNHFLLLDEIDFLMKKNRGRSTALY